MLDDPHAERVLFTWSAHQEQTTPIIARGGPRRGSETRDEPLETGHARGDLDEVAQILVPHPAQESRGGGQEIEEQAIDRVAGRHQGRESLDDGPIVRREREIGEGRDLSRVWFEGGYGSLGPQTAMAQNQLRDDLGLDDLPQGQAALACGLGGTLARIEPTSLGRTFGIVRETVAPQMVGRTEILHRPPRRHSVGGLAGLSIAAQHENCCQRGCKG
ncbi:hypothetical protein [Methylobacterium fujisawaense]